MIIRDFKNFLRDKIWVFLKVKWKLRSGISIKIENDSDWSVFNEIFTNKEYDPAIRLLLSSAKIKPLILDLGANVGYFTLKVADELILAGFTQFEIISFEASASNYQVLKKRVQQPLLNDKVKSYVGLVGYKTGTNKIMYSKQHYGYSAAGIVENIKTEEVSYIDIEALIIDSNKKIDLLKCDIEGSEEIFISTYSNLLKNVGHAIFEFHANECDINNCRLLLNQYGLYSKGIFKEDVSYKTSVELFSRR